MKLWETGNSNSSSLESLVFWLVWEVQPFWISYFHYSRGLVDTMKIQMFTVFYLVCFILLGVESVALLNKILVLSFQLGSSYLTYIFRFNLGMCLTSSREVEGSFLSHGMEELGRSPVNHCLTPPRCNGYLAIGDDGNCRVLNLIRAP